ncbi:MAG: transcription termination factor NusA [Candidatus Omnitrophica bacterium]|jgi:N utilization substance protein A|nr:transcription termination factor NusA [Candidatus Omnitrophota bacterium]
MKNDLLVLLDYWEKEKGVDRKFLISSLEKGLQSVYRKREHLDPNTQVKIDPETAEFYFLDENGNKITPPSFLWERIAAQNVKQIFIQKIKEAENNAIYYEFKNLENEIVSGRIEFFEKDNAIVSIGKAMGILPQKHMLPNDHFHVGSPVKVYIIEVKKPSHGLYPIILSRTVAGFLKKLLAEEIPEIKEGIIEIKSLARFPGDVSKIAVYSKNSDIDPVGTCIGEKASRIKNIVKELGGEKIEVVKWSPDPVEFTANAISPAKCEKIIFNEKKNEATCWVSKKQIYLAIGKKGQNVRLACKLTGWNIIINRLEEPEKSVFLNIGISQEVAKILTENGFETIKSILDAGIEDIKNKTGLSEDIVMQIVEKSKNYSGGDKSEL